MAELFQRNHDGLRSGDDILGKLGKNAEDYLKAIYKLQAETERNVSTSAVARSLGVSSASVTNMIKKLRRLRLVEYSPYHGARLTSTGTKVALEVIRHHRLLELYLHQVVGMTWDKVDAEADELEHHISEELEELLDRALGAPEADPHGDPIPQKSGQVPEPNSLSLADLEPGEQGRISRVKDSDPELLRYLASLGLVPRAKVKMVGLAPFKGPLTLHVRGRQLALGYEVGRNILVHKYEG